MGKRIKYQYGQMIGECVYLHEATPYVTHSGKQQRRGLFKCLKCEDQNDFVAKIHTVKSGHTKSCGCFQKITASARQYKHGMNGSNLHKRWVGIKNRCLNKNNKSYNRYGGRGITMCDEWRNDFKAFYDYAINLEHYGGPGRTLDRINNDGNYEPGNVRWATQHTQSANKRLSPKNYVGYTGVTKRNSKYEARICVGYQYIYIGVFNTIKETITARNNYIIKHELSEYPIQKIKT